MDGLMALYEPTTEREYLQHEAAHQAEQQPRHYARPYYLLGLDLGQKDDYTALAVLQEDRPDGDLLLRRLERVRGKPYTKIVALVKDAMTALEKKGDVVLLVDTTGIGAAVVDQLAEVGVAHTKITIHGGNTVNRIPGGGYSVPKRDLVAALEMVFERDKLRIPRFGMRHGETLKREAASFRRTITASGNDIYSARTGEHDDLLLAVAMPVWYRRHGRLQFFFV